ncbi:hypothetical protein ACWD6P_11025 [Streptomyces sp. NPDC002446]
MTTPAYSTRLARLAALLADRARASFCPALHELLGIDGAAAGLV